MTEQRKRRGELKDRSRDDADGHDGAAQATDVSRRGFLKAAGGAGALSAATSMGLGGLLGAPGEAEAKGTVRLKPDGRRQEAFNIRVEAARIHLREKYPRQRSNGDEKRYRDKRASFFKCLPQDELGEVDRHAYADLLKALGSGDPADFEDIPLSPVAERRLANPQAAYAFELMSRDSRATLIEPAPGFASAEMAAEIGEVYWQALTRDVPFAQYENDAAIYAAVADLNRFSDIQAPTGEGGLITPYTVFRGGCRAT